ncbi:Clan MC, family M14, Zinc carboxypeptidase-like metallopeptidase [Trichomonas vaginalis G3]|uniref:Clan MC, family M14, Zinc carboxypeptidase-like metallopeptidase n=1 Tax=Trichomonas vaginalis (strain ATCC PRA-98 / G3) TaxID=412133 RepID=A2DC45_TRIV3|nr:protein deglutamylation [Trichomonas vaginalis G3]EAY22086.1 Clan MC, family M14, Zinc carboxypeptidase-like metallopeptidase [Trichomonas vaginalis G3]KAI5525271.1 protein deglutamylation [Trichomonas vaginalis G3]|eukprot:XP_001583072.1 Clan MC, family M14, Zinc carboxypeptidase-like metallopeptidase [Trichomonas vaginalis G3]
MDTKVIKKHKKGKQKKPKPINKRITPLIRMERPLRLVSPHNYPTNTFSKKRVSSSTPFNSLEQRRQVYPKNLSPQKNDIKFIGKFESGNLDSVFTRGDFAYEIHISPDPKHTAQWFYFKAENINPGKYTFIITGFHRDTGIHHHGVTPVALSVTDKKRGIGWKRIDSDINYWLSISGRPREYTMSFDFTVKKPDSIYFAYTYPYNYTDLNEFLKSLPNYVKITNILTSAGKLNVPMIFWDADKQKSYELPEKFKEIHHGKKPLIVIAARHHPGETCSSYAMEGFLEKLFNKMDPEATDIRNEYSFLIIPMVNVDGVVCGFYRPGLDGIDYNRVWKKKTKTQLGNSILSLLDALTETRKLVFFLDFHGHAGLFNAFTYTVKNRRIPLTDLASLFPRFMSKACPYFSSTSSYTLGPKAYDRTMRVALHHRYSVPFSYTLEMSIGGSTLTKTHNQFTPNEYREIGEATLTSMVQLLLNHREIKKQLLGIASPPKSNLQRDFASFSDFRIKRAKKIDEKIHEHRRRLKPRSANTSDVDDYDMEN